MCWPRLTALRERTSHAMRLEEGDGSRTLSCFPKCLDLEIIVSGRNYQAEGKK